MLEHLTHAFVTLFVTADPLSIVPLFIVLTANLSSADQRQIAVRAVAIAGGILIAFALFGDDLIAFFGITIDAFRIAGGLLLFVIAFRMVFPPESGEKTPDAPGDGEVNLTQIAVFPLAIPMMAGPGAISATILLSSQAKSLLNLGGLLAIIIVLMGLSFLVMLASSRIDKILGTTGRIVVSRLLGVILAALAIQFVADGVMGFATSHAASTVDQT